MHWNQHHIFILLKKQLILLDRYELVAAQVTELIAWLGLLRSLKIFSLRNSDTELVPPCDHMKHDLPLHLGAILLRLLPSTKSSQNKKCDIVIAWITSSGLKLGLWLTHLFHHQDQLGRNSPDEYLFRTPVGSMWTSAQYHMHHMHSLLELQQNQNDPTLWHIDPTSLHGIPWRLFSMHSYRRGADTHCTWCHSGCIRKAEENEKIEHK